MIGCLIAGGLAVFAVSRLIHHRRWYHGGGGGCGTRHGGWHGGWHGGGTAAGAARLGRPRARRR